MRIPRACSFILLALAVPVSNLPGHAQSSICPPVSKNQLVMANLCSAAPPVESTPTISKTVSPKSSVLSFTVEQINAMVLDDAPLIHAGDFMVFETNRRDFVYHLILSNGKEIVTQPLTREDSEDTSVAWRTGRIRLDYPEALHQRIVGQRLVPLHSGGAPLLIRGIKIDGRSTLIFELEKSGPGQAKPTPVEPPMSYPPDPQVMTASASKPDIWGRHSETGFIVPKLPSFSVHPMMFQSTSSTGDANHFKWNGKELDSETGLYNFGARYYSPALGRFVTPDPKMISKQKLFDPQQWNMYSYSRNNPTSMFDPDGKEVRFATEATAKQAISDYQARLPEGQRGAVGYSAREGGGFKLTVDAKAANQAGKDSNLAGLKTVADSTRVAEVHYVGGDTSIKYAARTNTDAPIVKTDTLNNENAGGVTLFEKGPTPGSPENNLGVNSATPGVTEIYVDPLSTVNLMQQGLPLEHETLQHFLPFTQTGDASKSAHPAPDQQPQPQPPSPKKPQQEQ